jgi:hypothetical protein
VLPDQNHRGQSGFDSWHMTAWARLALATIGTAVVLVPSVIFVVPDAGGGTAGRCSTAGRGLGWPSPPVWLTWSLSGQVWFPGPRRGESSA